MSYHNRINRILWQAFVLSLASALYDLKDLELRDEALYSQLRNRMDFDILEDSLSAEFAQTSIAVKNEKGEAFHCHITEKQTEKALLEDELENSLEGRFTALNGHCDTLSTGWWAYEWCHQEYVRQFHVDQQKGEVDPSWSLGKYESTVYRDSSDSENALVSDYFTEGQPCDETGSGRQTRVDFQCCSERAKSAKSRSRNSKATSLATFASITEPDLCTYQVTICTPLLCGAANSNLSAFTLIDNLSKNCLIRHEAWWSYEFCFSKGIRQFHVENDPHKKNAEPQVVAEFSLGKANKKQMEAISRGELNETSFIKPPTPDADPHGPSILELEYTGGTRCELTNQHRSTTVQFMCGNVMALLSVTEDLTCHYKVEISTPRLCEHPAFVAKEPPTKTVSCEGSPE